MTSTEIYFFSGTGNSLTVAKDLANKLHAQLTPIIPYLEKETVHTEADVIGFVFPIYDFKEPPILDDFVQKMSQLENKYVFAVCTYGVRPLNTMKKFQNTICSCGGTLAGGFTVPMPHNGLGFKQIPIDKQNSMFDQWNAQCDDIVDYVKKRKQGTIETSSITGKLATVGILIRVLPQVLPMLFQALTKGWGSLGFVAEDTCNGCGICEKICPVNNITMMDGKPAWSDKSISCFACLQWCPKEAIQVGTLTKKMKRYHHPKIKVQEIIQQKESLKKDK